MAQDIISALLGSQPDFSSALSPQQSQQLRTNANLNAALGAIIPLLGLSGPQARPVGTGQALGAALGGALGGYTQGFDRTLQQIVAAQQMEEMANRRQARARYQDIVRGATTQVPQPIPMATGEGSQLEMLSRPEFGGDMAQAETIGALRANLPTRPQVDLAKLQPAALQFLAETDPGKYLELTAKAESTPASVKEYEFAVRDGFKGTYTDFIARKTPSTNINVNTEKSYGGAVAGKIADIDAARYDVASRAPAVLDQVNRTRLILDSGNVFVGALATPKLELARFGQELGVTGKSTDELVANTQTLMAGRAQATLDAVRASGLGAGQGFTDKDRQFLENARLGNITYSKKALQDQLDIEEKVARASVNVWNNRLDKIPVSAKEPIGLEKIVLPEPVKKGGTKAPTPGVKKYNPDTGRIE